jgi:hypothetical protein
MKKNLTQISQRKTNRVSIKHNVVLILRLSEEKGMTEPLFHLAFIKFTDLKF